MVSVPKYIKEKKLNKDDVFGILFQHGIIDNVNHVTQKGKTLGFSNAKYMGHEYVKLDNKDVLERIMKKVQDKKNKNYNIETRIKYPAKHRTNDGHFVRSKGEFIIDDWLYNNDIVHSYEKKLPVKENVYSDFYIRKGNVYIEYRGMEGNNFYDERREKKLEIYSKYNINLIEIDDSDLNYLDDILPKKLLEYGIKIY